MIFILSDKRICHFPPPFSPVCGQMAEWATLCSMLSELRGSTKDIWQIK